MVKYTFPYRSGNMVFFPSSTFFIALLTFNICHCLTSLPIRVKRETNRSIFPQRLGSVHWSATVLANPCNANPPPQIYINSEVLNVQGRERQFRNLAGNILAAVSDMASHMVRNHKFIIKIRYKVGQILFLLMWRHCINLHMFSIQCGRIIFFEFKIVWVQNWLILFTKFWFIIRYIPMTFTNILF